MIKMVTFKKMFIRLINRKNIAVMVAIFVALYFIFNKPTAKQGKYFYKKSYQSQPIAQYETTRGELPSPIYDENPLWVESYWRAWELGFKNFNEPAPGSGFVTQFVDASFNYAIFLWDMSFITMFCNYAHGLTPGIGGLDNFYVKQHPSGEICREIRRDTGVDCWLNPDPEKKGFYSKLGWQEQQTEAPVKYVGRTAPTPIPLNTLDAMNHPIAAWAEWESYIITGDKERLTKIWQPLEKYFEFLDKYLRQGNGLYLTDWASMDNSQRNPYLENGGTSIDISSEMVLFAQNLSDIFSVIGKDAKAKHYANIAKEISERINAQMWCEKSGFYYDLTIEGEMSPIKTVAAFWTLLSGVASQEQCNKLISHLMNPNEFWRTNPVPTLSADESGYRSDGDYWNGAIWAPTNTMVIRGLERYGYDSLARVIALKHIDLIAQVYKETNTIWENYAPDSLTYGRYFQGTRIVKSDFVGWSGIGPIMYLLEYGVGLKADARKKEVEWTILSEKRIGCERFRFGGVVTSLVAEPMEGGARKISIESDGKYKLILKGLVSKEVEVSPGKQEFIIEI